jgi:anaerobic selenocysteine-containing dehydrogenase
VRTVSLLPAVSGNVGRSGSGFLYLNGEGNRSLDVDYIAGTDAFPDVPEPIGHMQLVEHLADPARAQALVCFNINIAASNPDQRRLRESLARDDLFTVVVDLFATDTTDFADVVLPAASFLEFDDIVASYFHQSLSAQVRALDPPGEALPNTEIFRRIARAMQLDEPELHESDPSMLARLMAGSGTGLSFAELAAQGTIWPADEPSVQFAELAFATPSGRIEIASEAAEAAGHGRLPHCRVDARPARDHLRLLSPATSWMMNASFSNEPKIRHLVGSIAVFVHPSEARSRGLDDGTTVRVRSSTGQLDAALVVSDDVPVGVAYLPKGRWPKQEPGGVNVNVLNPSRASDMGESATFHATEVTLVAVVT